jgi:hypothetical protein
MAPARIETRGMHTTEPFTPTASQLPTLGEEAEEIGPIVGAIFVAGPPVLLAWAGTVLFALMLAGPFALMVTFAVVFAAAAAVVTLAGAILATPYLLVRHLRARLAQRRRVAEDGRAAITTVMARTGLAPAGPGIAALAQSTTARASR